MEANRHDDTYSFIRNLNRDILGIAIVPLNMVFLADLVYAGKLEFVSQPTEANEFYTFTEACTRQNIPIADVQAELFFWWKRSDWKDAAEQVEIYDNHNVVRRIAELEFIADHPASQAYLQAGIRNLEFIAKCIQDDVDAQLALTLLEVS